MLPTRSRALVAVAALALAAIACDGLQTKATRNTFLSSFSLFALTGAPANTFTSLSFLDGPVAASESFAFDIAVDIDASGVTRIYPVRTLAGTLAGPTKKVGSQVVAGSFESLTEAPTTGYDSLAIRVVTPGTVLAFEVQEGTRCLYEPRGSNVYAKLVIDSIRTAQRRIFARTVVDPNCGFRQLVPDSLPVR